jgi:hypothetical protein
MNAQRFYNPIVIGLLRSPLHLLGDQHTLILTVTGRKSGKRYTFPVSYLRDGDALVVMTHSERTWWKNLQGGSTPVVVYVDGYDLPARAEIATDPDQVANALFQFVQQVPTWRRELRVKLNSGGQPEHPEELYRLARQGLVVCRIQIESTSTSTPLPTDSSPSSRRSKMESLLLMLSATGVPIGIVANRRWGRASGLMLEASISALWVRACVMLANGATRRLRVVPTLLLCAETVTDGLTATLGMWAWVWRPFVSPVLGHKSRPAQRQKGRSNYTLVASLAASAWAVSLAIHTARMAIYVSPGRGLK